MNLESRPGSERSGDGIVTVELRFDSMRQFQAEFSPNLSSDGVFIPTRAPIRPARSCGSRSRSRTSSGCWRGWGSSSGPGKRRPGADSRRHGPPIRFSRTRSQELIDSLVDAFVAEGGSPFELESFGEGDEFIPPTPWSVGPRCRNGVRSPRSATWNPRTTRRG